MTTKRDVENYKEDINKEIKEATDRGMLDDELQAMKDDQVATAFLPANLVNDFRALWYE